MDAKNFADCILIEQVLEDFMVPSFGIEKHELTYLSFSGQNKYQQLGLV